MSGKQAKISKKLIGRQVRRIKEQGMKDLVSYMKNLSFWQRCILAKDIILKKNLGV